MRQNDIYIGYTYDFIYMISYLCFFLSIYLIYLYLLAAVATRYLDALHSHLNLVFYI